MMMQVADEKIEGSNGVVVCVFKCSGVTCRDGGYMNCAKLHMRFSWSLLQWLLRRRVVS